MIVKSENGTQVEMPRYRCHKEVWALKIKEIKDRPSPTEETAGNMLIVPEEERFAYFEVSAEYMNKHNPEAGGYYVVYADGYKSFSPAKAFEEEYTLID